MKLLTALLFALSLAAQEAKTPPPEPPKEVEITIKADGVETSVTISESMADSISQYMHLRGYIGNFGERMVLWLFTSVDANNPSVGATLMAKPELTPASMKADLDAEAAARAARQAKLIEAAKPKAVKK